MHKERYKSHKQWNVSEKWQFDTASQNGNSSESDGSIDINQAGKKNDV